MGLGVTTSAPVSSMPRVARSAIEQFVILDGCCRGYLDGENWSVIAKRVGVSRATVRARVKDFIADGRDLVAYLDAHRPRAVLDEKLQRKRQHARERQRTWQRRKNGLPPEPGTVRPTGRPRKSLSDADLDRFRCMDLAGTALDRQHIERALRSSANDMTSGVHFAWTTAAVVSQWRPLSAQHQAVFDTHGLRLADVVPGLLRGWGWMQNNAGVWVDARAPRR